MKKTLLKIFATLFVCSTLAFGFTACKDKDNTNASTGGGTNTEQSTNENNSSSDSSNNNTNEEIDTNKLSFKTLSLDSLNVYGCVSNTTTEFSFVEEIDITGNTKFSVSKDKYGSQTYLTKVVPLEIGDNSFYIFETLNDEIINTYTVTLRRRPIYTVSFNTNGGTEIQTQQVEEDNYAIIPQSISKTGYTFKNWDYDFNTPIKSNTTITASWTANIYKINFDLNGATGSFPETTATYDSPLSLNTPERSGYIFLGWYIGETEVNDGDIWNLTAAATLKAKWQSCYFVDGNTITNTYNLGAQDALIIPKEIDGTKITGIDSGAFSNNYLTSVTIHENITFIGGGAFSNCNNLQKISVDENNPAYKSIDGNLYTKDGKTLVQYAIGKAPENFLIPNTVEIIADMAFGCSMDNIYVTENQFTITIPESVTTIGQMAFTNINLQNIIVDESNPNYQSIDGSLYSKDGKTFLQYALGKGFGTFEIPDHVTTIGEWAFYCPSTLKPVKIVIPSSINHIGYCGLGNTFNYDESYNEYEGGYYFGNDENPYLVLLYTDSGIIHKNTKIIYSFGSTPTNLTIPASVEFISDIAFDFVGYMDEFVVEENNQYYQSIEGNLYSKDGKTLIKYATGKTDTTFEIPFTVTKINPSAFRFCTNLISITIPENVTEIGQGAFSGCEKLIEIYNKSSLEIEKGSIDNGCVGYYAQNIYTTTNGKSNLSTNDNGFIIYTDEENKILMGYIGDERELILPNGITEVYKWAFYNCNNIQKLEIPDSVTKIGESAFGYCSNLTIVYIGNGVKEIGINAFGDCPSLALVNFGENICVIENYAFNNCYNLNSIYLPQSLTYIGEQVFVGCRLQEIGYAGTTAQWALISKGEFWCDIESPIRFYTQDNPDGTHINS